MNPSLHWRAWWATWIAFFVVCLLTAEARANGRFPNANQLVVTPGRSERLVLRATFGLLVSADRGGTWDWICEEAMGYSGVEDPAIAVTSDGTIVAGLARGIAVSNESACSWSYEPANVPHGQVVDVSIRRDAPNTVYALVVIPAGFDAGYLFSSRLYVSEDAGKSWRAFGAPLDPTLSPHAFDVSATSPQRWYVSATRSPDTRPANGVLLVGDGEPSEWTEHSIPVVPSSERTALVAGIDPVDRALVYVRTAGGSRSRLLVSRNGGETFEPVFSGGPLRGFALSPDGARVFVGGPNDGLHVGDRSDHVFRKVSDVPIECLAASETAILACSTDSSGFALGRSEDEGKSFTPLLQLPAIRGPLSCPGETAADCVSRWPAVRDFILARDAGSDAAASDADAPGATPSADLRPGGSCSSAIGERYAASVLPEVLVLAGAAFAGLRMTRRRSGAG